MFPSTWGKPSLGPSLVCFSAMEASPIAKRWVPPLWARGLLFHIPWIQSFLHGHSYGGQRSLRAPFCSWGNRQKAWHVLLEEQKFQRLLELDICSFLQKHMCEALNYLPGNASGTGRWSRLTSLPPQTIYSSRGGRQSASKQINVFCNFRYDKGYEEKWSSERINCWRRGCFGGGGPLSSDFLNFLKAGTAVVPERGQNQANRVLPYLSFSRNSTDQFWMDGQWNHFWEVTVY